MFAIQSTKRKRWDPRYLSALAGVHPLKSTNTQSLLLTCNEQDDAEELAEAVFENNFVQYVGVFCHFIVVDLCKPIHFETAKCTLDKTACELRIDIQSVINAGRKQLKKCIKDIDWDYYNKRTVLLQEPEVKDNHITIFEKGTWRQREAVNFIIGRMISVMKYDSVTKRKQEYVEVDALQKLLEAFQRCAVKCGCGQSHCNLTMDLFGADQISPDRKYNHLSYSDPGQYITIVSKRDNTRTKFDSVPEERGRHCDWINRTAGSMTSGTKTRMQRLVAGKTLGQQSAVERAQVERYAREEADESFHRFRHYKSILKQKQAQCTGCFRCGKDMYFGDERGILRITKVGHQASPDRLDNSNPFYDSSNFDLACQSCNRTERVYTRTHVEHKSTQPNIPLTTEYLTKIVAWLKNRILAFENA